MMGELPSPEMEALAQRCTALVSESARLESQRVLRELRDHMDTKLDDLSDRLQRQIERVRAELREEITAVRTTQETQGKTLSDHGEAIGRIEERLENGDKKFDELNTRLDEMEGEVKTKRTPLLKYAGAAGKYAAGPTLAGAIGAAVVTLLGGSGTPPAPQPQRPAIEQRQPAQPAPNTKPVIQQE
jgi:chromosome segregation ATPase